MEMKPKQSKGINPGKKKNTKLYQVDQTTKDEMSEEYSTCGGEENAYMVSGES
jgi:hypothetical protein